MQGISKLVLFLAAATIIVAQNHEDKYDESRIIGGSYAREGEFPFIVLIEKSNALHCGGSIISPEWIISAAHCFHGYTNRDTFFVYAGLLNLNERYQNRNVQRVKMLQFYLHPQYQHGNNYLNDIAMLRLASPLQYNSLVRNINLPRGNTEMFGRQATTIGWGRTETGQNSNALKYFTAPLLNNNECQKMLNIPIQQSHICTFFKSPRQSACNGDSGGPLVQNNLLIGLVSWGLPHCNEGPTVYTKVSGHLDFINHYLH